VAAFPWTRWQLSLEYAEFAKIVDSDLMPVEERNALISEHDRKTPADQLHRYPLDMKGKPWNGIYAFEAGSFARDIAKVQQDIARLKELIFKVNNLA
jgi:hypothetical protein